MNDVFKDLLVVEVASVLAGPSVGLFFSELGAKVIKIENPKTNGDVTRSWKLSTEDANNNTSAYYWSVNVGKEILFLDLTLQDDLEKLYQLIKQADVFIANYKSGDDVKLKIDYHTLSQINSQLIYASINGFGYSSPRTAYDLILQAESGFIYMNGEKQSPPLKMPVALIDILAGHQLKEAVLIALLNRYKTKKGTHVSVSLFDAAVASLANQATNWLIAHYLPKAQGSLHPNIAPYGEIFTTQDNHLITFAIGSDKQFKKLCELLDIALEEKFQSNQLRVIHRDELFKVLNTKIQTQDFNSIYERCIELDIPIGKIRNLKEVFELPEAKELIQQSIYQSKTNHSVKTVAFKFH